jgi:alcohol dehydrogenase YqhD (iron-dependent ADH family)
MDAAKGIAVAGSGTASIWDYILKKTEVNGVVPPIIQIPTMAGTGSETNSSAVITNWETHHKSGIRESRSLARVAIIDPEITLSVPLHQTKAGGVDILFHLVEPYLTDGMPTLLTDGIRETCIKIVVRYLPRVIAQLDDIQARTELSWASTIAMSQFSRLGGGGGDLTCHGIEHALSGYYDITHGDGLAAIFPAWMKSFERVREDRFRSLARKVFDKEDGIKAIEEFLECIGMRLRLRNLGCELQQMHELAELAVKSSYNAAAHPTPLDINAITKIFLDSF